jgi:hypothetical protein
MSGIYDRPRHNLDCLSRSYPDVWKQVDALRARRVELGDWPSWCFMPLALAYMIIGKGSPALTALQHKHVTFLAALAAWRSTQGIYRFDPATFDALWDTPVTGDIPIDVLYCMPEWCVFIPTPDKSWMGNPLNGFFAHLEYDRGMRRTELRFLLDVSLPNGDDQFTAWPIRMGMGGVAGSLAATLQYSARPDPLATPMNEQERAIAMSEVPSLVSLVLYLCSENAEIRQSGGGKRRLGYPELKKTKKGLRLFPPDQPTHWEVGYRLGAALRLAGAERDSAEADPAGSHARPRPHIRRAHWHSYWVGKLSEPEARIVVLKWLPPIAVNVQSVDDLTTTIRDVGHVAATYTYQ